MLERAVQTLMQIDALAYQDDSWPEKVSPAKRPIYVKELRDILTGLRSVRDVVEIYSAPTDLPADESTS